jgi:hypothetical protein
MTKAIARIVFFSVALVALFATPALAATWTAYTKGVGQRARRAGRATDRAPSAVSLVRGQKRRRFLSNKTPRRRVLSLEAGCPSKDRE